MKVRHKMNNEYNRSELTTISVPSTSGVIRNVEGNNDGFNSNARVIKNSYRKENQLLGIFYIFLAVTTASLVSVIVKKVPYINPSQLSLIRNTGLFVGTIPITIYGVRNIFGEKEDRLLLVVRGFFSATALYMMIIAYRCLPLAETAVVSSTLPVVTSIIARLWLKEPCGLVLIISTTLTVFGVFLSMRIPKLLYNRENIQTNLIYVGGLIAAITGVLLYAASIVSQRKFKHVHFSTVMLYAGFVGIVENIFICFVAFPFVSFECGWDNMLCMLVGVFGFASSCWHTLAIKEQIAGLVTVEKNSFSIIIMILFQIMFFSEYPDDYVIGGACLVTISLALIGFKNYLLTMPEESRMRRKFKCFLD